MRYLIAGFAAGMMIVALDASTAEACSSASSCSRYVACSSGSSKMLAGANRYYCKRASSASTKTPTCAPASLKRDWRWNSSKKWCERRKSNGTVVSNTNNITCPSGYSYVRSSGKCQRAGGTVYTAPAISTSATGGSFQPFSSATQATRTLRCPSTYTLKRLGAKYYCSSVRAGASHTPTCRRHNMRNDWRWSSSEKKCYRYQRPGRKAWSDANIQCRTGYTYKRASGKCEKPGGTYHSTPQL